MPKDISTSEDKSTDRPPEVGHVEKPVKFECPADFVSFRHVPCSSILADSLESDTKELWLIKAPASFDPERFSGVSFPLSGLRTLSLPDAGAHQTFSVLASRHSPPGLRLLTCSGGRSSRRLLLGPELCGQLSVCESYGGGATRSPHVIPAPPPPSVPAGLRQRFLPFGSRTPRSARQTEGTGVTGEEGGQRRKRKKGVKEEQEEEVKEERREKKKKKKRSKEREEEEEAAGVEVKMEEKEVPVKCEPLDTWGEEGDGSERKKKKRKKKKSERD